MARGHRVASGTGEDRRFPGGTIALQMPFFRKRLPELIDHIGGDPFLGTINLRVDGVVQVAEPEWQVRGVRWTELFPAENFFFSRAVLEIGGAAHRVLLYIPDPATKPDHHQPPDRIELLARPIDAVGYDAAAVLHYRPSALLICRAG